ncbi:MAG: tRNA (adenosine(37)-N6)-threonylcarbamoyltransferase complex dimerization subunit type 1 TsaB [Breznakia sp.]
MKTLCMDTSHRYLILTLIENEAIITKFEAYAWKKQSETIFVELRKQMEQVEWEVDDLDEVVITIGPGSYTGIRIAMSIAKVLCSQKKLVLKTLSTLQLYAGLQNCSVILDARSNRVYYGKYENGNCIEEGIKTIDEIAAMRENYIGDLQVLGLENSKIAYSENFLLLLKNAKVVAHIHQLVPQYLKAENAYLVSSS